MKTPHNSAAIPSGQPHVPSPSFGNVDNAALPSSGLRLPIGPPGPPPDDGDWPEEGGDDDEEELVADVTPVSERKEKDLVDSRALQNARIEPLLNNASEYNQWKNTLILLFGRLDTSGEEALNKWITPAFHVDSERASECLESSSIFFHVMTGGLQVS